MIYTVQSKLEDARDGRFLMEQILVLPKVKPKKSRTAILYLLQSTDGLYKFGITRVGVKYRKSWAQRKTGRKFTIIATRIIDNPFQRESRFLWSVINGVCMYENSREFFTLDSDGHSHEEIIILFGLV